LAYIQITSPLSRGTEGDHTTQEGVNITGSLANKLTESEKETILTKTYAQSGDTVFFLVGDKNKVLKS